MSVWSDLKNSLFNDDTNLRTSTKTADRVGKKKAKSELKKARNEYKDELQAVKLADNYYNDTKIENEPSTLAKLWYRLKSIGGNTAANVTSGPLHGAGLIGALGSYPVLKTYAKLNDIDDDVFLPSLDNVFSRTGENLERQIRSDTGIAQYEDMDKTDQLINLATMFVGPSASKTDNIVTGLLKPGLQVTKGANKLTQAGQIGTQLGIPLALNEASRAKAEQPGILYDYSPKEDKENIENLVLASRSNASANEIYDVPVDLNKDVEDFGDKVKRYAKNTAKIAAPIAAIAAARHTKTAKNIIQAYTNAKVARKNAKVFSDTLSFGEKVLNSIDTKNITENALEKGFIDEKTANNLYRNTYQQTTNAFDTGTVYVGDKMFQTNKSPRWLLRDVQALKVSNPNDYKQFSALMENVRQLQSKVHEYNVHNKTNYTVYDVISKPDLAFSITGPDGRTFAETYKTATKFYNAIQRNGVFSKVLNELSDINSKMIDIGLETGELTPKFAENLRKNRTIFDLNLYLPGIAEAPEVKGVDKLVQGVNNVFTNEAQYKKSNPFAFGARSSNATVSRAAPWELTFENNYKNTMKRLLDNNQKRQLIKSSEAIRDERFKHNLDILKDIQKSTNETNYAENLKQMNEVANQTEQLFDNVKYLGEFDTELGKATVNSNPVYKILNKTADDTTGIERSINAKLDNVENQHILQAIQDAQNKAKYVLIPEDNKIKVYQVDDWLGQIIHKDPQNAGLIQQTIRNISNTTKSFITGKYNPAFSFVTGSYTATDQLTGLKSINKYLGTNVTKSDVAGHYIGKTATEPFQYKYHANELNKIYKDLENGKLTRTPDVLKQISEHEEAIRNSDINQIRSTGANLQGRYPINVYKQRLENVDDGFVVNSPSTLENLKKTIASSKLIDNDLIKASTDGIKYVGYALDSLREVPTLGLYKTLSSVFKTADGKIDANKIMKVSRALDRTTATGSITPAQNKFGKAVQGTSDTILYFSDMLSENIARGRMLNFKNAADHLINLIDSDVSLTKELKSIGKGITANDFVKSGASLVLTPTILAGMWNHATPENEAAYDALPDAYKSKGIVFANVANGKPVIIPLTQSLMWLVTPLREGLTDPILRKNPNSYNAGDNFGYALKQTADINWGLSMPPIAGVAINALGYRAPTLTDLFGNAMDKNYALDNLQLRNINYNGNTYYENGVFGPKSRAIVQTLFGNPGNAVMEAIDVASNRKSISQGIEAGVNKYLTTGLNLVNPKASTWSATSEQLYHKKENFDTATKNKSLMPDQQKVLDMIKKFRNSRLTLIENEIKTVRKSISELRNTGKTSEGEDISYTNVQEKVNDFNKQIKLLQSHELKEYETLDKILKQYYNTTYDEFMESIK